MLNCMLYMYKVSLQVDFLFVKNWAKKLLYRRQVRKRTKGRPTCLLYWLCNSPKYCLHHTPILYVDHSLPEVVLQLEVKNIQ